MGLAGLLFKTPASIWAQDTLSEVILGPISSEGESYSANVAVHPIEDGSNVSDHVHVQPPSFTIVTFLSDKNDLMDAAASLLLGADKSVTEKIEYLKTWHEYGMLCTYSGPVFQGF